MLEVILPEKMRRRPAAQGELNDQVLGRLSGEDAVYRALLDHAFSQAENDVMAALQPGLEAMKREWLAGRANGMVAYITLVEGVRERAREEMKRQQREAELRAKKR